LDTIFSYIIQKRFSQVNEDVATDALAYLLESSEAARHGMMKLLQGIIPGLPQLRFKTQQAEGTIRPDMWGYEGSEPRVFIENKFWAGLTDNQPVFYLEELARHTQPTLLLVVCPAAREQTLWRELNRRLGNHLKSAESGHASPGIVCSVATELGPVLALTSWTHILSIMETEAVNDPRTRGDIVQLRGLCDSADIDAFTPISLAEISDQRTPALILQLGSIVQAAAELAVTEKVLYIGNLRPQASWKRIGRYLNMSESQQGGAGAWLGVHFVLWKTQGSTPLWLVFPDESWGRAQEVRPLIEPWAAKEGVLTVDRSNSFAIALEIAVGEEKAGVVCSLVDQLKAISTVLEPLKQISSQNEEEEKADDPSSDD